MASPYKYRYHPESLTTHHRLLVFVVELFTCINIAQPTHLLWAPAPDQSLSIINGICSFLYGCSFMEWFSSQFVFKFCLDLHLLHHLDPVVALKLAYTVLKFVINVFQHNNLRVRW